MDPFSSDPNTLDKNEFTCFCYEGLKLVIVIMSIPPAPVIHYGACVWDLQFFD
jgi:hypothetical protein